MAIVVEVAVGVGNTPELLKKKRARAPINIPAAPTNKMRGQLARIDFFDDGADVFSAVGDSLTVASGEIAAAYGKVICGTSAADGTPAGIGGSTEIFLPLLLNVAPSPQADSKARAMSLALAKRSAGSLARACRIISSISAGRSGLKSVGGGGGSLTCLRATLSGDSSSKGSSPVVSS